EKVLGQPQVGELFDRAMEILSPLEEWNRDGIEAALREVQVAMDLKPKLAFIPFYVAICGSSVGAPIFDTMAILGRDESLVRLASARQLIS
ncbi:MAG TPA: glutamate--tRNA ligase, partial [Actinomycetota bacterium]|nr:glutamate--tRNA ligase [Actinomycetota bacterium]